VQISSIDDAHECDSMTATASPITIAPTITNFGQALTPRVAPPATEQHPDAVNSARGTSAWLCSSSTQQFSASAGHTPIHTLSCRSGQPHAPCGVCMHGVCVAHTSAMTSPRMHAAKQAASVVPDLQSAAMCATFSQVHAPTRSPTLRPSRVQPPHPPHRPACLQAAGAASPFKDPCYAVGAVTLGYYGSSSYGAVTI
jgi:hypothetical protein